MGVRRWKKDPPITPFYLFVGWDKRNFFWGFLFSRVMRLQVGKNTTGTQRKRWEKGFQTSWLQITLKLRFLACISIFKQGFFSTLYLAFRLPQIWTFSNRIQLQNSLLRGHKKKTAEMCAGWVAAERDLRASAAFHKATLMCAEQLLVKANKHSTGCRLFSCQVFFVCTIWLSTVIQITNFGWQTLTVIVSHLVMKEQNKDRIY